MEEVVEMLEAVEFHATLSRLLNIRCPECFETRNGVLDVVYAEHKDEGKLWFIAVCDECSEVFRGYCEVTRLVKLEEVDSDE